MELTQYIRESRALVEAGLNEFIRSKYDDDMLAMVAQFAANGKRLRGTMAILCCEAMGGQAERAVTVACAVELAHSASLVKDDIMDEDEERRGNTAFWKMFGLRMGILVPDIVLPHVMLFTQQHGLRCLAAIADAWGRTAQGQFLDMPKGKLPVMGDYEQIIGLKSAPLFEVACDLGVRASKKDWHVNIAKQYGWNCGMAFQVFDDLCDMLKNVGNPWRLTAKGPMPVSMLALQKKVGSGETITQDDCAKVQGMADKYLQRAIEAAGAFPESEFRPLLVELPQFCCDALLAEIRSTVVVQSESPANVGIAGILPAG